MDNRTLREHFAGTGVKLCTDVKGSTDARLRPLASYSLPRITECNPDSTYIREARYDYDTKAMFVELRSGEWKLFQGVKPSTWENFLACPSKGSFLIGHIEPNHKAEKARWCLESDYSGFAEIFDTEDQAQGYADRHEDQYGETCKIDLYDELHCIHCGRPFDNDLHAEDGDGWGRCKSCREHQVNAKAARGER